MHFPNALHDTTNVHTNVRATRSLLESLQISKLKKTNACSAPIGGMFSAMHFHTDCGHVLRNALYTDY